jgi:hypothetical protein
MKAGAKALILAAVLLGGCRATRDVAVTSYHVTHGVAVGSYRVTRAVAVGSYRAATAPVHLIRGHSDEPPQTTTTTTSDVATPGYRVPATSEVPSQPPPQEQQPPRQRIASSSASATATSSERAATKPKASPSPRNAAAQPQFPTAKPVPGRAGLVYNPYDPNGGYIDVSGYAPGTKVKDPDSQKIFIVP